MTNDPATAEFQVWTAEERESFFAAIERHRAMAWRVDIVSRACSVALALIVSTLMAPLLYGIAAIALSLVNFIVPTPDLSKIVMNEIQRLSDMPGAIPATRWIYLAIVAALPGFALMTVVFVLLGRATHRLMAEAASIGGRAPNAEVLAEQRFANVVNEMAIAANLPPPRVLIADVGAVNAAVVGADEKHATVIVSSGLLQLLDRAELQGVAGHLIASIADGDLPIGARLATTFGLFGFIGKLSGAFSDRQAAKRMLVLAYHAMQPGNDSTAKFLMSLADPFANDQSRAPKPPQTKEQEQKETLRNMLWMPLAGPVAMGGFFGGMAGGFVLGPLLSLVWRRRKYMADATSVRLTRDPNALAEALEKMARVSSDAFAPWVNHMTVVHRSGGSRNSLLGSAAVPLFPSLERRLKALVAMGASVTIKERRIPTWAWLVMLPLGALLVLLLGVVLVMLVYVSAALSGLMTWLPAALIDALLRWLAS